MPFLKHNVLFWELFVKRLALCLDALRKNSIKNFIFEVKLVFIISVKGLQHTYFFPLSFSIIQPSNRKIFHFHFISFCLSNTCFLLYFPCIYILLISFSCFFFLPILFIQANHKCSHYYIMSRNSFVRLTIID